ncbi:MAG TPA: hypothetical protein VG650_13485 [Mycobacteriales bacterium]|nr:hypothetical protein [Mycobacteriales bacterium]
MRFSESPRAEGIALEIEMTRDEWDQICATVDRERGVRLEPDDADEGDQVCRVVIEVRDSA